MNEIIAYAYFDKKSQKYDTPFYCMSDIFARRQFIMAINNNGSMLSTFKDDFQLYCVGKFNLETGVMDDSDRLVEEGKNIVKKEKEAE